MLACKSIRDEVRWGSIVSRRETEIAMQFHPWDIHIINFNKKIASSNKTIFSFGSPKGNRTPDSAVRGRRLNRLTMGPYFLLL